MMRWGTYDDEETGLVLESGGLIDEDSPGTAFRGLLPEAEIPIVEYAAGAEGLGLTMLSILDNDDFNTTFPRTGAFSCTCS